MKKTKLVSRIYIYDQPVYIETVSFITARIRRMGEGNIFSLSTLAGGGGGGRRVPHPRSGWGGYLIPGLGGWGGYLIPGLVGGTPSQVWMVGGIPRVPPNWVLMVGGVTWPGLHGEGGYPIPGLGVGPHLRSGGGVPHPRSGWWGYPDQVWMGGVPHPTIRQSSIASTCYAAGGVPLAFTQEDFLVGTVFIPKLSSIRHWNCGGNVAKNFQPF